MNRRASQRRPVACAGMLALLLAGCSTKLDHLVFSTYTKTGLDITIADGTPTDAVFGYKRFEGAVVPVDPTQAPKMHSVYAGLCIENSWIRGLSLGQVFATGSAATNVANDSKRSQQALAFLECGQQEDQ